jgi:ABC-type Zn2+ transport system substrate-binding protein/surface adhesin
VEPNQEYWNTYRDVSYCLEDLSFGTTFAPIPDHPQALVLAGKLGEINMQKADAVKKENFSRAQELKSLLADVEKQISNIEDQNTIIRRNAKKYFSDFYFFLHFLDYFTKTKKNY